MNKWRSSVFWQTKAVMSRNGMAASTYFALAESRTVTYQRRHLQYSRMACPPSSSRRTASMIGSITLCLNLSWFARNHCKASYDCVLTFLSSCSRRLRVSSSRWICCLKPRVIDTHRGLSNVNDNTLNHKSSHCLAASSLSPPHCEFPLFHSLFSSDYLILLSVCLSSHPIPPNNTLSWATRTKTNMFSHRCRQKEGLSPGLLLLMRSQSPNVQSYIPTYNTKLNNIPV